MIGIVTDSAASLPWDPPVDQNVVVVPLRLDIDGHTYTDLELAGHRAADRDLAAPVGLAALGGGGAAVCTSGPSPGEFADAICRVDRGDGVLVLTVSAKMSSTHEAATLGARLAGVRAEVLDTGTAAGGEALVVHAAAESAAADREFGDVVARAKLVSRNVRLVAQVGDLRPLVRGGRLPSPLARLGKAVGLRPVFEFRRGSIRVLRPALSPTTARDALLAAWRASIKPGQRLHVSVSHGDDESGALSLLADIEDEVPATTAFVGRFSPAMVSHTGTDVIGLAWWWEPAAKGSVG